MDTEITIVPPTTDPRLALAKDLVRHLIAMQVDNAEHIYLIAPLTQSYDLLMNAATALFGRSQEDIESQIKKQRSAIERYRPLVPERIRLRDLAERYERALNEIANETPTSPRDVARRALADEEAGNG